MRFRLMEHFQKTRFVYVVYLRRDHCYCMKIQLKSWVMKHFRLKALLLLWQGRWPCLVYFVL